jgi:hypothetical protein
MLLNSYHVADEAAPVRQKTLVHRVIRGSGGQ